MIADCLNSSSPPKTLMLRTLPSSAMTTSRVTIRLEHFGIFGDSGVTVVKSRAAIKCEGTLRICCGADVAWPTTAPVAETHVKQSRRNERMSSVRPLESQNISQAEYAKDKKPKTASSKDQ